MRTSKITAFLAANGLAAASPAIGRTPLNKRTNYDLCNNNCQLAGVPVPNENTFGLPLEDFWSEQCPPTVVGPYNAPLSRSRVCLNFAGTNMLFNFETFPGYVIKSAVVTWKVKGNVGASPSTWSSPPPTTNIICAPSNGGQQLCTLPFSEILQVPSSTSVTDLLAGMCPNTDREALGFYFQFSGLVEPVGGGPAIPFVQQYPCTTREGDRSCSAYNTVYPYIEVAYRCSTCEVQACPVSSSTSSSISSSSTASSSSSSSTPSSESLSSTTSSASSSSTTSSESSSSASSSSSSSSEASSSTSSSSSLSSESSSSTTSSESSSSSTTSSSSSIITSSSSSSYSSSTTPSSTSSAPPTLKTCSFGTGFGYQNPVAGQPKSFTLDTQSGRGCNRWGWYETPTLAELQGGISGPLYVGAGGNDITKATEVGIWVATANALGRVTVTYLLNPPYTLAEVHVNLVCLPLTTCAPGQYTYNAGAIPNLPTWSNPTPLVYPTCTGGSRAALIVHASVNILTVTTTCPDPKL